MRLARLPLAMLTALATLAVGPAWAGTPAPRQPVLTAPARPSVEDHAGFGRLILPASLLPVSGGGADRVRQDGNTLILAVPPESGVAAAAPRLRDVIDAAAAAGETRIILQAGTRIRAREVGGTLVIDLLDPPAPRARAHARAPARGAPDSHPATAVAAPTVFSTPTLPTPMPPAVTPPAVSPPAATLPAAPVAVVAPPAPPAATAPETAKAEPPPLAAPVAELPKTTDNPKPAENNAAAAAAVSETPVAAAKNPASVADAVAILPVAGTAPQILLPTPRDTGLAAFRAGPDILIVLDTPIPFQPPSAPAGAPANASLDPAFASLTSTRTQDATVLRLKLAAPNGVRLERDERGWVVTLDQPPDNIAHIVPRLVASGATLSLRLPASAPSRVVTVADPRTGENLLVGTQGSAGEAVDEARQQIQFSLPRTLQGVVVAPKSDDLALRPDAAGFVLTAGPHAGGSLAVANDDVPSGENESGETQSADSKSGVLADAAPRSRLFDLPDDPPEILARRLAGQIAAAAAAPALSRAAPRLRVATTMLALGMGVEAQSVIDIATEADPALADDPKVIGLRAAAEILAGRPDAAATLADPRLGGTTEVLLWRALLRLARGSAGPRDGNDLAAALPLLLAYPPTLRQRLLPTALETIALTGAPTGQAAARSALANFPDDPSLDLARAMMLEATNQPDAALARYDAVAGRGDRLPRYTALVRAAELRLKLGKLDARTAADALDKALFGWRAPGREQGLRLRIAALRRQAGQWDAALDVLRDGRAAFPDDPAAIDRGIAETFAALFSGDAARHLAPGDFVALYDKNADLAAAMTWPESLGMKLVDRLVERGLQGRAAPVLARLEEAATDPPRRAVLGARLAALRLTLDDPAGALAALADSVPPVGAALNTIDPAVLRARQFLYARAEAGRGHADAALAMFAALDTADADEARADIFAARGDWPRGLAALAAVERKRIPATATPPDTLTDSQQALVLRLAQAATLAGDGATLSRLGAIYGAAMAQGGGAAPFRLLISAPVRSSTDLPRAYEEIQLARKLPANLATR